MPSTPAPDWMSRARETLAVLRADPVLWAQMTVEVDAFFHAHPAEPDTPVSRDLMKVIVFRRLTSGTQPEEQKENQAA